MLHLPRVDGVDNYPNNFDLDPVTCPANLSLATLATFDLDLLDLDPHDIDIGQHFLKLAENWNFYIFDLDVLDL